MEHVPRKMLFLCVASRRLIRLFNCLILEFYTHIEISNRKIKPLSKTSSLQINKMINLWVYGWVFWKETTVHVPLAQVMKWFFHTKQIIFVPAQKCCRFDFCLLYQSTRSYNSNERFYFENGALIHANGWNFEMTKCWNNHSIDFFVLYMRFRIRGACLTNQLSFVWFE